MRAVEVCSQIQTSICSKWESTDIVNLKELRSHQVHLQDQAGVKLVRSLASMWEVNEHGVDFHFSEAPCAGRSNPKT